MMSCLVRSEDSCRYWRKAANESPKRTAKKCRRLAQPLVAKTSRQFAMSIHEEIYFKCKSQRVFDALTKAEQFGELSGAPAEINLESGGKFSCFGGMISGLTIESAPDKRLVQAWRAGNWAPGVYSIVKFELEEISDTETKLVFDHTGFPEEHKAHLEQGWHERYWEPMKKYLEA